MFVVMFVFKIILIRKNFYDYLFKYIKEVLSDYDEFYYIKVVKLYFSFVMFCIFL